MKLSSFHQTIIVIVCIIASGAFFGYPYINEFPNYIHNWAQSDRYALAIGFVNNGGDFFHPQTYLLNNQFPGDFNIARSTTITSVDFPVYDYIVSLIMHLFNTTDPWCFRVFTLVYSLVGLLYLYKLTGLFTQVFVNRLIVVLFAASSPVFLYYQVGFLPTVPSLANAMIGLYFFFSYQQSAKQKQYYLAVLFLTIAALARLPFAVLLVAIFCYEAVLLLKRKQFAAKRYLALVLSVIAIVLYFQYNNYLRNHYGSLFLNYIIPASGVTEFKEFLIATYERWAFQYFTGWHYIILFIVTTVFFVQKLISKAKVSEYHLQLVLFAGITAFGCMLYYVLMTFQYLDHDYYFLDTFYLPTILLLIFLISALNNAAFKMQLIQGVICLVLFVPVFLAAKENRDYRRNIYGENLVYSTAVNFSGADQFLDALQIPDTAKILVMSTDGPNNPFILMKRRGFAVIYPDSAKISRALQWPFDYVVLENSRLVSSVYQVYPEIKNRLYRLATNEKISVYARCTSNEVSDLSSFLGISAAENSRRAALTFDSIPSSFTSVGNLTDEAYSGKKAGRIESAQEWASSWAIKNDPLLNQKSINVVVEGCFNAKAPQLKELLICVSIDSNGKNLVFQAVDLASKVSVGSWSKQEAVFSVPKVTEQNCEMKVFVWNKGKNDFLYDDITISIY